MLLLAFPAPESFSCCLGSGDWPLDPQEILLHPQDLEKLRVPAFGYVAISRNNGGNGARSRTGKGSGGRPRPRSAAEKTEAAAIWSTTEAAEQEGEEPFAFPRAVPDDSLAPGETRVPAWLLGAAGVRPRQHLSVARAPKVLGDGALSETAQVESQQSHLARFRVDLCLFPLKQPFKDDERVTGSSSGNARAIARRASGCMVSAGSLLAAEVLGETVVLRVTAICDRGNDGSVGDADGAENSATRRHLVVNSNVEVNLMQAGDSEDGLAPSWSGSPVRHGREKSRRRRRQQHERPAPDCPARSSWDVWGQRAPGLEAALTELHALVLLSVGSGGADGGNSSNSGNGSASKLRWSDILPAGILLCGPSGVGKTLALDVLADDLSKRHGIHVIRLLGPQILAGSSQSSSGGGGAGDSATSSPLLQGPLGFSLAQARARAPSVLVFDELDALFDACGGEDGGGGGSTLGEGARAAAALLEALDRASAIEGVAVLGATRRSPGGKAGAGWAGLEEGSGGDDGAALPAAFRKPGRFDRCVSVGPPTQAQREKILRVLLSPAERAPFWELEPLVAVRTRPAARYPALDQTTAVRPTSGPKADEESEPRERSIDGRDGGILGANPRGGSGREEGRSGRQASDSAEGDMFKRPAGGDSPRAGKAAAADAVDAVVVVEEWAKRLSSVTPGMVGGDLERLVRTARARAIQRRRNAGRRRLPSPRAPGGDERPREAAGPVVLAWQDALGAVAITVPRSLRGLDVASSGGSGGGGGG
ncbi:unnamed protein product, partial [Hapterophycus canaliculatus]